MVRLEREIAEEPTEEPGIAVDGPLTFATLDLSLGITRNIISVTIGASTGTSRSRPCLGSPRTALAGCGTAGMTDGRQGASSGTWSSIIS
jgi:hypothetical protein